MNELETFKDWMDKWKMDIKLDPSLQDLKQEAIKWVKEGLSEKKNSGVINWIIYFFNLSEEDLQ